jgi:hypothetical protein
MTLEDILQDIHAMEQDLQSYERKYGVLSETFYTAYLNGEEPEDEAWVRDWSAWAGTYEIWLRRREQYRTTIQSLHNQAQPLAKLIERTARHEPIPVPV